MPKGIFIRTKEHKRNISKALRGILRPSGKKSPVWVGSKATYSTIHNWLRRIYGYPSKCEKCGTVGKKINKRWNIEWALLKGKTYIRERENFWGLCHKCHQIYDNIRIGGWNKGLNLTR